MSHLADSSRPIASAQPAQVLKCGNASSDEEVEAEVTSINALASSSPTGRTPLCEQIRKATKRIEGIAPQLRAMGQRCVLVIASDGAATDGQVAEVMRPLERLPVWVVVRLCTDDDSIVQYWNDIDEQLELELDVLDDLAGEAAEIHGCNPWLTYGVPLHRLREWGTDAKVFDLCDEKRLSVSEMMKLVSMLIGASAYDLPHPEVEWSNFEAALRQCLQNVAPVYDPLKKQLSPWINLSKLRSCYSASSACICM